MVHPTVRLWSYCYFYRVRGEAGEVGHDGACPQVSGGEAGQLHRVGDEGELEMMNSMHSGD